MESTNLRVRRHREETAHDFVGRVGRILENEKNHGWVLEEGVFSRHFVAWWGFMTRRESNDG